MPDMQNPHGNPGGVTEFDEFAFSELEIQELFWLTNSINDTFPHRKLSEDTAVNLKVQQNVTINGRTKVYIKN